MSSTSIRYECEDLMAKSGVQVDHVELRAYPEETIVIIYVPEEHFSRAIELVTDLDRKLFDAAFNGFVTIKKSAKAPTNVSRKLESLHDPRISELLNLLSVKSRASELNPSLEYIPNANDSLTEAMNPRHHIIFGRRGSGKTSLLAEANRIGKQREEPAIWMNIQTYRHENAIELFLAFTERLAATIQSYYSALRQSPQVVADTEQVAATANSIRNQKNKKKERVVAIIPTVQRLIRRFIDSTGKRLFIYLDDFHYLSRDQQPLFLDYLHGAVRDTDAWLKVATIKHLTRWFESSSNQGLQLGHDAISIDLDLTLQNPNEAKVFLEKILSSYADKKGVSSINKLATSDALDRLVLASGAVPRDYLTLCGDALKEGRNRTNAKLVGVQDINKAAGDAKQRKIDELEDDAAANLSESQTILGTLKTIRDFCLEEKAWTYFRVDFNEKEKLIDEYAHLQMLVDLRLLHMIEDSLSDEHKAGHKAEVYMLDLSQYVGQRLKRKLSLLDLTSGKFALRQTGSGNKASNSKTTALTRVANTPNQRLGILRRCPQLPLSELK